MNGFHYRLRHTTGVMSWPQPRAQLRGQPVLHHGGRRPLLDGQYAAFGKVTEGMEVAQAIVSAPRTGPTAPTRTRLWRRSPWRLSARSTPTPSPAPSTANRGGPRGQFAAECLRCQFAPMAARSARAHQETCAHARRRRVKFFAQLSTKESWQGVGQRPTVLTRDLV